MKTILHFAFAAACAVSPNLLLAAPTNARPNVVFILADDLGVNDLSLYGSKYFETPHIDALARRGMKFTQAYSASPLCSPTRSSILSGLYPARLGITAPDCHLPKEVLEKQLNATPSPLSKGFIYPFPVWKNHGQPDDHLEDLVCDEAVKFIEQHKEQPFFLNYWAFEVHSPWQAKESQIAKYRAKAKPDSLQRNPVHAGMIEPGTVRKEFFLHVDLMSTLAEGAQIALPAGASPEGASELAAFTKPASAPAKRTEGVMLGSGTYVLRLPARRVSSDRRNSPAAAPA